MNGCNLQMSQWLNVLVIRNDLSSNGYCLGLYWFYVRRNPIYLEHSSLWFCGYSSGMWYKKMWWITSYFQLIGPWQMWYNLKLLTFKFVSRPDILSFSCVLWNHHDMNTTRTNCNDQSTLVHVMGCCGQATNHCFWQCRHSFMPTYGITRP